MLEVRGLTFSYGGTPVLQNVSFSVAPGAPTALLGPNGAGKSTLFGCILGFLKPQAGKILLDGRPLSAFSRRELSRELAYIPQSHAPAFNYTVLDCVLMGMTGSLPTFARPGKEEAEKAMEILKSLGMEKLARRGCRECSGGERQLMLLARALAQDAKILVMDEPTANLDFGNRVRVMERTEALGEAGYTIFFSTHDPNQALRYAGQALALKNGGILAQGPTETALTQEILSELYGVPVAVREVDGYRVCLEGVK
jgi:iron complex transport system ATP-binding protein